MLQLAAFIPQSPAGAAGFVYQLSHQSLGGWETAVAFMSIHVPQSEYTVEVLEGYFIKIPLNEKRELANMPKFMLPTVLLGNLSTPHPACINKNHSMHTDLT